MSVKRRMECSWEKGTELVTPGQRNSSKLVLSIFLGPRVTHMNLLSIYYEPCISEGMEVEAMRRSEGKKPYSHDPDILLGKGENEHCDQEGCWVILDDDVAENGGSPGMQVSWGGHSPAAS